MSQLYKLCPDQVTCPHPTVPGQDCEREHVSTRGRSVGVCRSTPPVPVPRHLPHYLMQPAASCPRVLSLTLAREAEASIGWLDRLPGASSLCLHMCLKGFRCDAAPMAGALRNLRRIRLHSCVEEPGGDEWGHEGVCVFRFLIDNYNVSARPWDGVYFAHADVPRPKHTVQYGLMHQFFQRLADGAPWPQWPDHGPVTNQHCGCHVMSGPFGPVDFWYKALSWYLGHFIKPRDHTYAAAVHAMMRTTMQRQEAGAYLLHNGTLSMAEGYMFAVDSGSALARGLEFLQVKHSCCVLPATPGPPPRPSYLQATGKRYAAPGPHRVPLATHR